EMSSSPERYLESRDLLAALLEELRHWLTPEGRQYFQLLYVDQQSIADVAQRAGTTTDALYAWRSRLVKKVRKLRDQMMQEDRQNGR
ncbi:MAG: hypothetical protein AAFV29_01905, partial [Myxococcota bacterium]